MIEVGIFAAKAAIIVLGISCVLIIIAVIAFRSGHKSELEIEPLHKKYKDLAFFLKSITGSKAEVKEEKKRRKTENKKEQDKKSENRVFVLDFNGNINADQVESLREEVSAVLMLATEKDEVVVKLESPGGVVHGYGLAASELARFKTRHVPLTVCVDKIAASGGYMMACVANKIIAAPFAILGSIGVVAQLPNFYKLLQKHDVDYKIYTAGEYKRTVTVMGEITPKGEDKFKEQLEDTHQLFKSFVAAQRPKALIDQVATGEYWYGERALKLGLVDEILTSDDYLLKKFQEGSPIYTVKWERKQKLTEKITDIFGSALEKASNQVLEKLASRRFP